MRIIHNEDDLMMMSGSSSNVNNNEMREERKRSDSMSRRMRYRQEHRIHVEGSIISNQTLSPEYYEELEQEKNQLSQSHR